MPKYVPGTVTTTQLRTTSQSVDQSQIQTALNQLASIKYDQSSEQPCTVFIGNSVTIHIKEKRYPLNLEMGLPNAEVE